MTHHNHCHAYRHRRLTVAVAATCGAALLAACGSSSSHASSSSSTSQATAAPHATLKVLLERQASPAVAAKQSTFLTKLTSAFEKKYPSIRVKISTYPGSPATLVDTMVASHRGPNVMEVGTTFIPTLTATGAFVPWTTSMLKQVKMGHIVSAATRMDAVPGKAPVGIPDSAQPFALWYNKAMFAKAGIKSPPRTWNQFLADAKTLTDPAKGVYGAVIAPADPFYNLHVTWLLSRQNGGQVINSAGTKAMFASPPVASEVKFYLDWLTKYHVVAPSDVQYQESNMIAAFVAGKAAMAPVGGLYDLAQIDATASKTFLAKDLGVASNPVIPFHKSTTPTGGIPTPSFVSGQEQAIFKYGSSPAQIAAAVKWIRFYTSASVQEQLPQLFGTLPINKNAYTASYLRTPLWKTFERIETKSAPTPQVAGWLDLPTVYDKALATVFDDATLGKYHPGQLSATLKSTDTRLDTTLASLASS